MVELMPPMRRGLGGADHVEMTWRMKRIVFSCIVSLAASKKTRGAFSKH